MEGAQQEQTRGHKTKGHKCVASPPTPLFPLTPKRQRNSCWTTAMKPVHPLQKLDQKRVDKVKWVRKALEAGKSPLTEAERDIIAECSRELEVNKEATL